MNVRALEDAFNQERTVVRAFSAIIKSSWSSVWSSSILTWVGEPKPGRVPEDPGLVAVHPDVWVLQSMLYCTVLYCTVLTSTVSTSGCTRTCPRPWTTSSAAERCSTETSMSSVFVVKYFSPFKIFLPHIHVTSGSWRSSRAALSTTCPSQDSSVLTWSHLPSITVKKGNFKLSTLLCQL